MATVDNKADTGSPAAAPAPRGLWWVIGSLYLAQGLPMGLTSQALPALLREYGASLTLISAAGLLSLPWSGKWLLAPWVDHHYFLRLGRRRSWILPMQLLSVLLLAALAFIEPSGTTLSLSLLALFTALALLNVCAATQDIATDGLAVSLLATRARGMGNALQVAGYRLGLIIGGGVLLIGIDRFGWRSALLLLAALLVLVSIPVWRFREPSPVIMTGLATEPQRQWQWWAVYRSFFQRTVPGPVTLQQWLIVLLIYKAGESLGSAMVKPMLVDWGVSLANIGWYVSGVGALATMAGAFAGGVWLLRTERMSALLQGALLQSLAIAAYALLAWQHEQGSVQGEGIAWFYIAGAFEHFASGFATAVLLTGIMDMARPQYGGSDFSLQHSILVIAGGVFYLAAGPIAEYLGYVDYFLIALVITALACVPLWWWRRSMRGVV